MQDESKGLILNLISLGFDLHLHEVKYGCQFNENTFDKPNKRAFEVVTHFLFQKFDQKQANQLYRVCFPGTGKKCAQEFRKVTYNWLKKISEENPKFELPKVSTTLLMAPGGKDFVHLMFMFSIYVLYKCTVSKQPEGLLLPLTLNKRRSQAQRRSLQAIILSEFQQLQHQMQMIEKTDNELQAFMEEQVDTYRSLQKKKKILLQKKRQLLGEASNFSELKSAEYKKLKSRKLEGKMKSLRASWNRISQCVEETAKHREIIESVLNKEEGNRKLDGGKLHPTVPAKLIDECQEEIYQTIGTSLYENGKVNLTSLVALENLSLTLIADTLHEDGLPNYDKQNSFLKTQLKLHGDELAMLYDARQNLEEQQREKKISIKLLEEKLDEIYLNAPSSSAVAMETGLDVPDSSIDLGRGSSSDLSLDRSELILREDYKPSSEGIASKYLLPSEDQDAFLLGLYGSSDQNLTPANDTERPVEKFHHPCQAWEIPAFNDTSYRATPQSRKPTVIEERRTLERSILKQGKSSRTNNIGKIGDLLRRDLASHLAESSRPSTSRKAPKKARGRKSMSLPSSPLMTYRSNDVTVQKMTSRTPEAERKLVEQIVDCTVNTHQSPLLVYNDDGRLQLDRSVFFSHDKIPRTPPQPSLLQSPGTRLNATSECPFATSHDTSSDDDVDVPFPSSKSLPGRENNDLKELRDESTSRSHMTLLSDVHEGTWSSSITNIEVSSAIDQTLASIEHATKIMDISTPSFADMDSFDGTGRLSFDIPVTDNLICLDEDPAPLNSPLPGTERIQDSQSGADDLLMVTPPNEDSDSKKENYVSPLLPSYPPKDLPASDAPSDRSPLHPFQLDLLPVPDFFTPELNRYKSVLKRK